MSRFFMFRGFVTSLIASSALTMALPPQQPGEVWHNRTSVDDPQVNARNVINDGQITAFSPIPWDSQNTINFTNRGTFSGAIGWRFETVTPPFGFRTPALNFFNSSEGEIAAQDSFGTSLIKVNAQNVTNRGLINVGANGLIQIHGRNVDLTGGALVVNALGGTDLGGGFPNTGDDTNFFPSAGIYDDAWGISTYTNTRIDSILTGVNPAMVSTPVPPPIVTNTPGSDFGFPLAILLDEAMLWSRTNVVNESNEVVQLIAVQVSDPNIGVVASFTDETFYDGPEGGYQTAAIELQVGNIDFNTLERVTNSLYILDQLGASTNRVLMENLDFGTFRPGNFIVHRGFPNIYGGQPAMTNVLADLLLARADGTNPPLPYVLTEVTNDWAAYSATVESVAARLPVVPGATVTNMGGSVEVYAQQLNIRNTRIRGEGFVSLNATNVLIAGANLVDAPRLSIDFASGPGNLEVNDFVPDFVERFNGTFDAYGTVFTNFYERMATNITTDAGGASVTNVVTNAVEVRFQVTIVDARGLQTREPVSVYDLRLTSTNGPNSILFNENMVVLNYIRLNARELTLAPGSSLSLAQGVGLSYTNLLNIQRFTNYGTIFASELADLRSSEFVPYESFHNAGFLLADGIEIWADSFYHSGGLESQTLIDIKANNILVEAGSPGSQASFVSSGDIRLQAENVTIANSQSTAGARLVIDASQTLTDRGIAEPNVIAAAGGVELSSDRPAGDLLGTTIILNPDPLDLIDFIWSAEDRGPSTAGFQNNLALGRLVLEGGNFAIFQFLPARENSALYVDVLEVNGAHAESLVALTNGLILGMNIYYSDVLTTSTNGDITAEMLNGVFGPDAPFNLIWVPEFVGPSAVDVQLGENGPLSKMKLSLRQSMVADTDGDGIPNAEDAYPLTPAQPGDGSRVELVDARVNASAISFNVSGAAGSKFVIEYSTNLLSPDWKAITGTLNADELGSAQSFSESIGSGAAQGYYRVKLVP